MRIDKPEPLGRHVGFASSRWRALQSDRHCEPKAKPLYST